MGSKLYIRTFGCQMNEYDSAKMADILLSEKGMELAETPEEADLILFNTCSVREKHRKKFFMTWDAYGILKQQTRSSDWCGWVRSQSGRS